MADFDLIQTDAQVQSILNDGQNMQGAGAQTTLTTESVLLKDVNGNYHKILKSSFTEAVRDTLAGLLVNNDKGTTINQIAAIASGDFGSITPANLASVLGALKPLGAITGIDLDTVYGPFFGIVSSSTNLPGTESNGVVIAIDAEPSSHDRAIQLFMRDDAIYFRIRWQDWTQSGEPVIWQPWHKLWPQT